MEKSGSPSSYYALSQLLTAVSPSQGAGPRPHYSIGSPRAYDRPTASFVHSFELLANVQVPIGLWLDVAAWSGLMG